MIEPQKTTSHKKANLYQLAIKFIIKYACNEIGMDFEQKETAAKILTNEVCLAGELNDENIQKYLIQNGCLSLMEFVQGQEMLDL